MGEEKLATWLRGETLLQGLDQLGTREEVTSLLPGLEQKDVCENVEGGDKLETLGVHFSDVLPFLGEKSRQADRPTDRPTDR